MINKFGYSFFLMIILLGCAHTHRINQKSRAEYYDQINQAADGKEGRIILVSGETFRAGKFRVASDSTSWINIGTWKKQTVPTSLVNTIEVKNPTQGAVEGCLITSLASGLIFPVVYFSIYGFEDQVGNLTPFSGFGVGAFIGSLAGMIITHQDKFIINNSAAPSAPKSNY